MAEGTTSEHDENNPNSGSSTTKSNKGNSKQTNATSTVAGNASKEVPSGGFTNAIPRKTEGNASKGVGVKSLNSDRLVITTRRPNGKNDPQSFNGTPFKRSNGNAINGNGSKLFNGGPTKNGNGSKSINGGHPTSIPGKSNGPGSNALNGNGNVTTRNGLNVRSTTRIPTSISSLHRFNVKRAETTRMPRGDVTTVSNKLLRETTRRPKGPGRTSLTEVPSATTTTAGVPSTSRRPGNGVIDDPSQWTTESAIDAPHSTTTTPQTVYDSLAPDQSTTKSPEDDQSTTTVPEVEPVSMPGGEPEVEPVTVPGGEPSEGEPSEDDAGELGEDDAGEQGEEEQPEYEETSTEQPTTLPPTTPSTEPKVGEEDEEQHLAGKRKGPLEYDLEYMYPEIELLTKTKRRDWNFNDPEIIRAIWLEAKTHALADWKQRYVKISRTKEVKVHDNQAVHLRNEYRKMKQEKAEEEVTSLVIGRNAPRYRELTLPTTMTAQMRYKINRDDPPIPDSFIFHFAKYKKPPFMKRALPDKCRQSHVGN